MVQIQLHNDCPTTDTLISNRFIDDFMPQANGEFVRYIYIYYVVYNLMHIILQFLRLQTNLIIPRWTSSARCVIGRRPES